MTMLNRTMQLGRLTELNQQLENLKIEIHAAVTAIITHFEPLDRDLEYVKNIKAQVLIVNVRTIERKMKIFQKISDEIQHIKDELGENGG